MQTARNFVAAAAKLTPGVQYGHDHFQGRFFLLGMDIHRDAAAVIFDGQAAVGVDGDRDLVANSGQSFINRVINHFVYQMVKSFQIRPTHVHTWAAANSFEAF